MAVLPPVDGVREAAEVYEHAHPDEGPHWLDLLGTRRTMQRHTEYGVMDCYLSGIRWEVDSVRLQFIPTRRPVALHWQRRT